MSTEEANATGCLPAGKLGSGAGEVSPEAHQPWNDGCVLFYWIKSTKPDITNRPVQYAKRPPEGSLFNVLRLDIIR
jgi:hypothetical protein